MDTQPTYLFLDFDGVLHPYFPVAGKTDTENAHFSCLKAFETAVRDCPTPVRIVISSTWRNRESLSVLKERFSRDIQKIIVGVTPNVEGSNEPGGRLTEVRQWLVENGLQDARWIGIDDYPELYGEGVVVACNDEFGAREKALLLAAVADPAVFMKENPCRSYRRYDPRIDEEPSSAPSPQPG